ncbi:hypothetical protein D3C72_915620 [compost metagenome]
MAISSLPKRLRTMASDTIITSAMAATSTKYIVRLAASVAMSQPSSVRKSVMPLAPPVSPCWPTTTTVSVSASDSVTIAKYTPLTRRLKIAYENT